LGLEDDYVMSHKIYFVFFFLTPQLFAQNLPDRKVFCSAGKDLKNLTLGAPTSINNKITFTMGEPIMGLVSLSGKRLNIGFIQPDGIFPIAPPSPVQIMVNDPFFIAPNPAYNYTFIKAPEQWEGKVNVQLIDANGKLISTMLMEGLVYELNFEQHLPPGNYYINFYKEDGTFLQQSKLIKMNKQ
jgi:hypothetical protein